MIWKRKNADAASDDYQKNWSDIGLHPDVVALQDSLLAGYKQRWPHPRTITDLGEEAYGRSVDDFMELRGKVAEAAERLFEKLDERKLPDRAFATEDLLKRAISNKYDPWSCCFDLVFRQNYRFPPSFSVTSSFFTHRLNDHQKKFIYLDIWWGRVMNSGADPMFSDPMPDFIAAWWSIDVIWWPAFGGRVRRLIETIMRTTPEEIIDSIGKHGLLETGYQLKLKRVGDREGHLDPEHLTPAEDRAFATLEKLLTSRQAEFERRVLKAVWTHRAVLIQPPPDGETGPVPNRQP